MIRIKIRLVGDNHVEKKENREVRVYALLDPALLIRNEAEIKQVFGHVLGVNMQSSEHVFYISQTSGWFYYTNTKKQWAGKQQNGLLATTEDAKKYASTFLTEVAKAFRDVGKYPFLKEFEGVDFIPPLAKVADANYVMNDEENGPDHVLVRYQTAMYGDDEHTKFPVMGAAIEVRVGTYGEIVGFNSRWSIMSPRYIRTPLTVYEKSDDGHSHDHGNNKKEQEPILVYSLGGDDVPQYMLSPYYLTMNGHHFVEQSACKYSLTVKFGYDHQEGRSLVRAQVKGGSGRYSFHWSYYKLEEVMHNGVIEIHDNSPEITIPESCYAWIRCHIIDMETNAYLFHTEQSVGLPRTTEPILA